MVSKYIIHIVKYITLISFAKNIYLMNKDYQVTLRNSMNNVIYVHNIANISIITNMKILKSILICHIIYAIKDFVC